MALSGTVTGKNGTVKTGNATFGSATDVEVRNWQFTRSRPSLDVTDSGTGDAREKVAGKRCTVSGSFDALLHYGDTLQVQTELEAHFAVDDTNGDEMYWSGQILITEQGVTCPIEGEDVVMINYSFDVDGDLTLTDDSQA